MNRTGSPPRSCINLALFVLATCCAFVSGCSQATTAKESSHDSHLTEAGKSAFTPLQEELALLEQAQDTPAAWSEKLQKELDNKPSFLVELNRIFRGVDTARITDVAEELFATSQRLTPSEAQAIRELRVKFSIERKEVEDLLTNNPPLGFFPALAFSSDFTFVDASSSAQALLLFEAAENCVAGRPSEAISALTQMFALARKLEEWPVATTRLEAAKLRRRALRLVAVIAEHPRTETAVISSLATLLHEQLKQWCDDAELVRGERIMGLMVYERVRRGEFASLLASAEYERLKQQQLFMVTQKSVRKYIDLDEAFYLRTMRELQLASRQPYFQRVAFLTQLREQITELSVSPEYPYIAGNFLLQDFEPLHLTLAIDLARCQAWWLALKTSSTTLIPSEIPLNPLTGIPFEISQESDRWIVRGVEGELIAAPQLDQP